MKAKIVSILLGAICALLATQIPSEGQPKATGAKRPAPAPVKSSAKPSAVVDPACQQVANQQAFCVNPAPGANPNNLCSYLPPDSVPPVGYTAFSCKGQVQFDNYSWATLVALNWPANPQGQPCNAPGPGCTYTSILTAPTAAPRVWDYFLAANQVIPSGVELPLKIGAIPGAPSCGARAVAKGAPPVRVLTMTAKSDGSVVPDILEPFTSSPLIDRNLNYTMYEILLNQNEATYITTNKLNTVAGQEAATSINFPCGKIPGGKDTTSCPGPVGGVGAIEIKAAWRILDPAKGDDLSRYFWREQDLYISADRSADHKAFCISKAKLGLVGFHILHKTASQPQWFWSTFEHKDNAPPTTNGTTCVGPAFGPQPLYSYYQWQCPPSVCKPNAAPPGTTFLWNPKPPYAAAYATAGKYGTQVVRCQPVEKNSPSSPILTNRWQQKLGNTVWSNYQLTGTQWGIGYTGAPPAPSPCYGGNTICAPPYLLNSVQETYMQEQVKPSQPTYFANGCVQCHALATTVGTNQKPADFSFILGRVSTGAPLAGAPSHKKP
jgi:hypothetical protein